ncbi:MAG: hypothetical protein ACLTZM_02515 [Ruminococcus sp.]
MKEKPVFPLLVSDGASNGNLDAGRFPYITLWTASLSLQISEDAMTALSLVYPVQNFVNAVAIGFWNRTEYGGALSGSG